MMNAKRLCAGVVAAVVTREQRRAFEDAVRIHDELEWYIASNGLSCRYSQKLGVWTRHPDPKPFVPSGTEEKER